MFCLISDYTKWHYSYAVVTIIGLAQEFVRFFFNLFSVSLFLRSLFSPIFSIPVNDMRSPEVSDLVAGFMGGFLTRIVGAIFRGVLIILGLVGSLLSIGFFCVVTVLWICLPVVVLILIYLLGAIIFSMI